MVLYETTTVFYLLYSPAIIDESCDFESIASRIIWGKLANAGQVRFFSLGCVSP